jgi:hypothetical protein
MYKSAKELIDAGNAEVERQVKLAINKINKELETGPMAVVNNVSRPFLKFHHREFSLSQVRVLTGFKNPINFGFRWDDKTREKLIKLGIYDLSDKLVKSFKRKLMKFSKDKGLKVEDDFVSLTFKKASEKIEGKKDHSINLITYSPETKKWEQDIEDYAKKLFHKITKSVDEKLTTSSEVVFHSEPYFISFEKNFDPTEMGIGKLKAFGFDERSLDREGSLKMNASAKLRFIFDSMDERYDEIVKLLLDELELYYRRKGYEGQVDGTVIKLRQLNKSKWFERYKRVFSED